MIKILKHFFQVKKLQQYKQEVNFQEKLWLQLKPIKIRKNKIEQEKKEIKDKTNQIKFPSWTKMLLTFLFINFTILELFIGYITIQSFNLAFAIGISPDFTPLVTLIGLIAGETISYGVYCAKSKAENTKNGVVYDTAMFELEHKIKEKDEEVVG